MEEGLCQKCDACSDVCPIVEIKKDRRLSRAFEDDSINPWLCCSCQLCAGICPAGLSARDQLFVLRRLESAGRFRGGEEIPRYIRFLRKRGFLFPVNQDTNKERVEMGLPEIDLDRISSDMVLFFSNLGWDARSTSNNGSGVK